MRCLKFLAGLLGLCFAVAPPAHATVNIQVNLPTQTMSVTSGSGAQYEWPVSTARAGYTTPRGTFRPQRMMVMAYSIKYHMSPMPHSIFFTGGYAIHGTYEVGHLGRRASHGCVRLAPGNAATLFSMVQQEGARISIFGGSGQRQLVAHAGRHHHGRTIMVAQHHHHHHATALAYSAQPRTPTLHQWLQNPIGQ
jgi:hypothetical protein